MVQFPDLTETDFIGYGFLLVISTLVYLYVRAKRWFGTELDYLGDDDSDDYE